MGNSQPIKMPIARTVRVSQVQKPITLTENQIAVMAHLPLKPVQFTK